MSEFFPERRKSSTDLLPLPKAIIFHRSPSPSKRSFSDLLSPFIKKSHDDSLYFLDKLEPNAKRQAKLFPSLLHKLSTNKIASCDNLYQYLQNYSGNEINEKSDDAYSFIDELSADMGIEIFQLKNRNGISTLEVNRNDKLLVLCELISSEIVYLKQLHFIVTRPMPILFNIKDQFFRKVDVNMVFGNLLEVFRCNVVFWTDYMEDVFQIVKSTGSVPDLKHMIDGFTNIAKYFMPYRAYCMNIASNCEYISRFEDESDTFKVFTEWCRNSDASNRLGLDTFITLPFQRITRYSLFLDRIAKECTDNDELEQLFNAINEVDKFVNSINKKVKVKDLTVKLYFFQNILDGFPTVDEYVKHKFPIPPLPAFNLLCPMQVKSEYDEEVRCLIHQDTLQMKNLHKKTCIVKLLLFTDLIIIAKPIKKNQQCRLRIVEQPITLDQLIICDINEMTDESCFYVAQLNQFSCFTDIIKFSNAKSSSRNNSAKLFRKKIDAAKVNYEMLMSSEMSSNVHINVINPEEMSDFKDDETPQIILADQQNGSSSTSDNESDCDLSDITTISTSSSSWTDLENNLNSCIITDPFINYSDSQGTLGGVTPKFSHRLSLQNVAEKIGRKKADSITSCTSDASFLKNDGLWNILRWSSFGIAKHATTRQHADI